MERPAPLGTLPVLVASRPHEPEVHGLSAGFAAQMLGQGGARRGLRGGPGFVTRALGSYQAAAAARPSPVRARLSI